MGTSKGYSAPGSWGPLIDFLKSPMPRRPGVATAIGWPHRCAFHPTQRGRCGHGPWSGAGGTIGGAAGRAVAQRLGAFIAAVGQVGLAEALRREGLADLDRPVQEILAALLDRSGGPASRSMTWGRPRPALARLQEEQLEQAAAPRKSNGSCRRGLRIWTSFRAILWLLPVRAILSRVL